MNTMHTCLALSSHKKITICKLLTYRHTYVCISLKKKCVPHVTQHLLARMLHSAITACIHKRISYTLDLLEIGFKAAYWSAYSLKGL